MVSSLILTLGAVKLGQVPHPYCLGVFMTGTETVILFFRTFFVLPFMVSYGVYGATLAGILFVGFKAWVYGNALIKGFRVKWSTAFILLALSVIGSQLIPLMIAPV